MGPFWGQSRDQVVERLGPRGTVARSASVRRRPTATDADACPRCEVVRERRRQVVEHEHGLQRLLGGLLHACRSESVACSAATIRRSRRANSSGGLPPRRSRPLMGSTTPSRNPSYSTLPLICPRCAITDGVETTMSLGSGMVWEKGVHRNGRARLIGAIGHDDEQVNVAVGPRVPRARDPNKMIRSGSNSLAMSATILVTTGSIGCRSRHRPFRPSTDYTTTVARFAPPQAGRVSRACSPNTGPCSRPSERSAPTRRSSRSRTSRTLRRSRPTTSTSTSAATSTPQSRSMCPASKRLWRSCARRSGVAAAALLALLPLLLARVCSKGRFLNATGLDHLVQLPRRPPLPAPAPAPTRIRRWMDGQACGHGAWPAPAPPP